MTAPAGWYPDPSGKPMQRYFDGSTWTEHYTAQGSDSPSPTIPPNVFPQNQIGVQGSRYPRPAQSPRRRWLVIAAIAAAIVVGVVVLVATSRDGKSYQAGRAYGSRVLNSQLNEYSIGAICATGAALAHDRDSEVDEHDFAQGCKDSAK